MSDPISDTQILGTLLTEFRKVGDAISDISERCARTEQKVETIGLQIADLSDLTRRVEMLEHESAIRSTVAIRFDQRMALFITVGATVMGGAIGALITHFFGGH